jgi:5'-nucleotidase
MSRGGKKLIGCLASLAIAGVGAIAVPLAAHAATSSAPVVISEIYPGGGGSTGVYTHDYVELHNKTAAPVNVTGWTLRYRSSGGTSWSTSVTLSGSIAAGDYVVIQTGSLGSSGSPVPAPDYIGSAGVNLSATAGHVALVDTAAPLACTTTCAAEPAVQDLVGYGAAANGPAGTPAPSPTDNSQSIQRNAASDNTVVNGDDFSSAAPTPNAPAVDVEPPVPTAYTIAEIQGTATSSQHVGELVVTEGVVTAAYPTGGFNGFVIQTEGTGGFTDIAGQTASDGITVVGGVPATLAVGDFVSVTGTVQENFGLTRIVVANAAAVSELAVPFDAVTPVTAPWPASAGERETIESMLYTPQGQFTVSETFPTNQFGEVGLATGTTPLMQPSDRGRPGSAEFLATEADNFARGVTLDDGVSTNYLSGANRALVPPFISLDGSLRVGSTPTFATNVIVDFQFGAWRFQPLAPVTDANDDAFVTFAGTRPATPDPAALGDGEVKIATFNVLNYFTTGGVAYEAAHPGADCVPFTDRVGNPVTVNNCGEGFNGPRGAWEAEDLARQQAKTVAAIIAMDADVVGLMEMENSANMGEAPDEATAALVDALNAAAGPGTWAFIPSSAELPDQSLRDVITNAIIYQPAVVTPVGASRALGALSGPGQAFDNAREPIGQAFVPAAGGDPFFVAVNHFKSKGCSNDAAPADQDLGDGQSCFNASRVAQAQALTAWVDGLLPTYSPAITDAYLVGDFNAYTYEDPMQVFYDSGYVDLNAEHGNLEQSYNFDGLNGSLDHIVANPSAAARVTGSDIWNINAPESLALEYSRYNYHGALFYAPDPYRSSDHDPEVAAIRAGVADPEAPVITAPAPGSLTSDPTPTISGSAAPGTTVEVIEGATILGTATTAADGSWTMTSTVLAEGAHTITATVTDEHGQISPPSAPVTFTVDSVAPGRPTITSPAQLAVVRTTNVPVVGTGEPAATITVQVDGSAVGTTAVDAAGGWSLTTPPLTNGLHLLTARAVDAAGNRSAVSNAVLIVVCDSAAPGGRSSIGWRLFCRGR